jgi:2-polyprenyl-3-methyl-5-hydroxy-6-metoxy-1,4-benzoquinol methylase
MSYDNFLSEFARAQGVGSVETLLTDHSERYSFQIKSRDRAKDMIAKLSKDYGMDFKGKRVLDVGCAYGSFAIEMAKAGAHVVGIDISNKWLGLAEANAKDEVDIKFLNCDASSYLAASLLKADGPYDLFIVNDVFEHIYDTAGLVANLAKLGSPDAAIYYKIPNGLATRHVLNEGHKKVFGISLLAPDYWSEFVSAPFHIYYRRWAHFKSVFDNFGFSNVEIMNAVTDADIDTTRRFIVNDVNRIRRHIKAENFDNAKQYAYLRSAAKYYYEEVRLDLEEMAWEELFHKYRTTFWEGLAKRSIAASAPKRSPAKRK